MQNFCTMDFIGAKDAGGGGDNCVKALNGNVSSSDLTFTDGPGS